MSYNERLITAVSHFPILYDASHPEHKNKNKTNEAWRRVANDVGGTGRLPMINANSIFQPIGP